ncbi:MULTISPECIES: hypothetical protein [unclassified Mesorhizobium]|jgi:hypothetical protein|uniref:hypothetical protein n=1 Tax=unclassified Mesorhizobium TaxID=325217 RepID=UPI000964E97D|nr:MULTISPECIES: hypothetical protein [unclassified Mesorhizobium]MBN9255310.1 hypothetical protein [Mesorhizobium sp.]MBN9274615.1 hypothetical protein [Mesorhizobium sp.]OJX74231.1 MAG: hypothetical protein BGO93_16890 [Mesorhizobium sp. 65-26]
MPEQYWPKSKIFPLSQLNEQRSLVRVKCRYCKRLHNYFPSDLIQIFGDVDVDSLMYRMICEGGKDHGRLDVSTFIPSGSEAVGLRIRRLEAIRIRREPQWRDDP